MSIKIFESANFAENVTDLILDLINDTLEKKTTCYFALSGGSTPGELYKLLSSVSKVELVDWKNVVFFLGDERFVPLEDKRSNYNMFCNTFLSNISANFLPKVFPINVNASNIDVAAKEYSELIKEQMNAKDSLPVFDIMLLGLGEDGHTASLFPNDPAVYETKKICIGVKHPTDGTQRVSLTSSVICNARNLIFLSKGKAKASIVKEVIEGDAYPITYPSRIFVPVADKTTWCLDTESSSLLSK